MFSVAAGHFLEIAAQIAYPHYSMVTDIRGTDLEFFTPNRGIYLGLHIMCRKLLF
jgi:hypothetical protein